MDRPARRPRHLTHRPRLQPARGRAARRVRSAGLALTLLLAGCAKDGEARPAEDFQARYVAKDYAGLDGGYDAADVAAGLQRYVDADGPIYPKDGERGRALHRFLHRTQPDPEPFRALLGPHGETEITDRVLRRDNVAYGVVTSFVRRLVENPDDPHAAALYDVLALAGAHFSFDPVYGDSFPATSTVISDLFSEAEYLPNDASRAAIKKHLPALVASWRKRASTASTSTFFGIVLRHAGQAGGEVLFDEWGGMKEEERFDLLKRIAEEDRAGPKGRTAMVEALLDRSLEVRRAAHEALGAHGARVATLDPSSPDRKIEKALPALRRWAQETES